MPLYEYLCDVCAHRFEVIQKFSDAPIAACPTCGGSVQKLISSPAIQFKGSGFYLTDYGRGTGKAESAAKGEGDKTKAEGKPDGAGADAKKADGGKSEAPSTTSDAKTSSGEASAKPTATKSE